MITESIDEIFKDIDLTIEYITVELVDGEKVTIRKSEYDRLKKDEEALEMCLFY